ncbi:MAG: hypothetical protein JXQ76_00190 [Campylobacterales bacterium]|nr:hypothetical protein [Campylobacterales bacterium]
MKNLTKLILLTILLLSSVHAADTNTSSSTEDAMKKIDSVEDDFLASLEADAKKDANKSTDKETK